MFSITSPAKLLASLFNNRFSPTSDRVRPVVKEDKFLGFYASSGR
jgi:hypothetical protein